MITSVLTIWFEPIVSGKFSKIWFCSNGKVVVSTVWGLCKFTNFSISFSSGGVNLYVVVWTVVGTGVGALTGTFTFFVVVVYVVTVPGTKFVFVSTKGSIDSCTVVWTGGKFDITLVVGPKLKSKSWKFPVPASFPAFVSWTTYRVVVYVVGLVWTILVVGPYWVITPPAFWVVVVSADDCKISSSKGLYCVNSLASILLLYVN